MYLNKVHSEPPLKNQQKNELVRLLLHVKLASANSVFAENIRYLSFKYQITREDWNKPHSFLLGKVKFKKNSACTIYMSDNC